MTTDRLITPESYGNTAFAGVVKLSVAPGTTSSPVAVGANDPVFNQRFLVGSTASMLPNSVNMGALASGIIKQSVAGGVSTPSIANLSDTTYPCILGTTGSTNITLPQTGVITTKGYVDSTFYSHLSAGAVVLPTFTDNGDGSVTIGNDGVYNLYSSSTSESLIQQYSVSGGTFVLTDATVNYVYVDYNSGIPQVKWTITRPDISNTFLTTAQPLWTLYRNGTMVLRRNWDQTGIAALSKAQLKDIDNTRFTRDTYEGGFVLSDDGTQHIDITGGSIWSGWCKTPHGHINSATTTTLRFVYNGSTWVGSSAPLFENTYYQGPTGLVALSPNKFAVTWVYRCVGDVDMIFYVIGGGNYKLIDAQNSQPPLNLPGEIKSFGMLVGRIITQQGATVSTQVDSAFAVAFSPSGIINHNDTSNIQDAPNPVAGEHYHLNSVQATQVSTLDSAQNANTVFAGPSSGVASIPSFRNLVVSDTPYVHYNHGFENRTDSTLSFNSGTRVFTIAPVSTSFNIWSSGSKITKSIANTVTIANTVGLHFIYYDASGTLTEGTTAWDLLGTVIPVATVYWNGSAGTKNDERHNCNRNRNWHNWAHLTIGTRYQSGLAGSFTNTTFSIASGILQDEDIVLSLGAATTCSLWRLNAITGAMTFTTGSTTAYASSGGVLQYDNAGTLTNCSNGDFVINDVYGTDDMDTPIYVRVGTAQYTTSALAQAAPLALWPNDPTAELKLLYRVVYRYQGGNITFDTALDYRSSGTLPGGGVAATTVVTDSSLTGNGLVASPLSVNWPSPGAIGSTAPNTGAFTTLSAAYTTSGASSAAILSLAHTWNTSGTPTLAALTVTDTTSNLQSKFISLTYNGALQWSVNKDVRMFHQHSDFSVSVYGDGNDFVGSNAGASMDLNAVDGAFHCCFFGGESGRSNTKGYQNTFFGNRSGVMCTTGHQNTCVGQGAGYQNIVGSFNVNVGYHAGLNVLGDTNVFLGAICFQGAYGGTATAYSNIGIGVNVAYAVTTAYENIFIGYECAYSVTTAHNNVVIGTRAGYGPTGTGALTTGVNNIIIGNEALPSSPTVSNEITLGNSSTTAMRVIGVGISATTNTWDFRGANPVLSISDTGNNYNQEDVQCVLYFNGRWYSGTPDPSTDVYGDSAIKSIKGSVNGSGGTSITFWTAGPGAAGLAERFRIDKNGNLGIATITATNILSLGGDTARTIWMERRTATNSAGLNLTVQAGGSTSGMVSTANLTGASGGTGYTVGDVLTLKAPIGGTSATVTVATVDGSGTILTFTITTKGALYTTGVKATTGGTGTGATINVATLESATDKAGGTLVLQSGVSSGTGASNVEIWAYPAGSSGATDNTATKVITFSAANGLTLPAIAASPSTVGTYWYDSTQLCQMGYDRGGVKNYSDGTLWVNTAATSAINSGNNTQSVFGTLINTKTTPAGFWIAGRKLYGKVQGVMTTVGTAATIALALKLGSTTIASFTTGVLPALSAVGVEIEFHLTCQSVSAPNSAIFGWIKLTVPGHATSATSGFTFISVATAAVNITTANTQIVDLVWTWGGTISTSSVTFYDGFGSIKG